MREAWAAGDADAFADLLVKCHLYLPGFPVDDAGEQRLLTRRRGDQTFLLVFTSVEALHEAVAPRTHGWRLTSFAELTRAWPDPAWGLAVSPHTPIGAYLGPEQVRQLAERVPAEPAFHPADEKERAMCAAHQVGDPAVYLDLLVVSDVLVPITALASAEDLARPDFPWRVTYVDGLPTVSVFTSVNRLRESIADEVPTVRASFVRLARAWPGPAYRLAVNPGSAISATFTGSQIPDLVRWAQGLALRQAGSLDSDVSDGSPATPVAVPPDVRSLEVPVTQAEVDRYLVDGYDRVSGVVRSAGTGSDRYGYLVRWYGDVTRTPPGRPVTELVLPHGAHLIKLVVGEEVVLGSYDAELRRWNPSIADILRGFPT
jgi:hypothetical protein